MFSYLRSNNRRSALPPAATSYTPSSRHVHSLQGSTDESPLNHAYRTPDQPSPSPISPDPPVLPPIPRVASHHESSRNRDVEVQPLYEIHATQEQFRAKQQTLNSHSSELGEARPVRRDLDGQPTTSSTIAAMGPPQLPLQQNPESQNPKARTPQASSDPMRSQPEPFSKHTWTRNQEQSNEGAQPARAPPPPPLKLSSGSGANVAQSRQGKTKFNLLNPMALLARRRSHQAIAESNAEKAQHKGAYPPVLGIPADFDPRIRGKVVHDFSAPRPGTTESSNRARGSDRQREAILYNSRRPSPNASASFVDDDSPSSGEREHTPQFKEHFDEDFEPTTNGPAKQRTSAFMYQVSLSESQPDPDPSILPPFARHLPLNISTSPSAIHETSPPPSKEPLEIVPESSDTASIPIANSISSTPPSSPPIKARSRASSNTDPSYQPAGLPRHFKSNASRFSFDLTGVGSAAQEKILEDKHRQHEKNRARRSDDSQPSATEMSLRDADDEDEYGNEYDDLDDDDSLEEKIPGVNADADEPITVGAHELTQDNAFVSPCKSSFTSDPSLASTGVTSPNTPRDILGIPATINPTHVSSGSVSTQAFNEHPPHLNSLLKSPVRGLACASHGSSTNIPGSELTRSMLQDDDEDDLYFDDGMIEDPEIPVDHTFDETVFDDDTSNVYGVPLRDRKPSSNDTGVASNGHTFGDKPYHGAAANGEGHHPPDPTSAEPEYYCEQLNRSTRDSFNQSADLSNNASYLDALALGINEAALNGKFNRWSSMRQDAEGGFDDATGSLAHMQGDARSDAKAGGLLVGGGIEDTEDFEFDDALADDSIIAAANAEALENDDEGFYGQEFGFFARASGAGEAEYANGGYFGSRGLEGIGRSHSGRNNEPSLTPITERSEWSNRNSAISLAMHGFQQPHSAGTQPSAGLAQLADLMHLEDDDLSLSALLRLRRGAWGGSNASLQSSSSGSPLTYVPGVGFPAAIPMQHSNSSNGNVNFTNGSPLTMHIGHNHTSSSYSLASSNGFASSPEDSQPSPVSATITYSTQQQTLPVQQPPQSAPAFFPQQQQQQFVQKSLLMSSSPGINTSHQSQRRSMSPVKRSSKGPPPRPSKGHSRNGSNTSESVSYVHEMGGEDGGPGRWVLEKRRTDESGMVEVLGREVVEGGRI
ncbi:MAG: hypothetical protein Q9224_000282 [Gallowayella concinna]